MTSNPDWKTVDKWLMGEAFVGSRLDEHLYEICERIGPRWAGTAGDEAAGQYIKDRFEEFGLSEPRFEEFDLKAWDYSVCEGRVVEDDMLIALVPMIHCPPVDLSVPLVDVGFGMPHEIESCADSLPGSIAVVENADEPFTTAVPLPDRLRNLAAAGCVAAIAVEPRAGGHVETVRATDKRWNEKAGDVLSHPLPTVQTHREDGVRLRRASQARHSRCVSRAGHSPRHATTPLPTYRARNGPASRSCSALIKTRTWDRPEPWTTAQVWSSCWRSCACLPPPRGSLASLRAWTFASARGAARSKTIRVPPPTSGSTTAPNPIQDSS